MNTVIPLPRRVIQIALGALLLAHTLSTTVTAAPKPAVTVLVHGFTPWDGATASPFAYWGGDDGENFTALLKRFGSGRVWQFNPANGDYENITASIPEGGSLDDPSGHQILLFDWREASNERESGQAEAAADALFASLMDFRMDGRRIISLSPYAAQVPLHFIGHSRGTIVVSETVQRLGRYNIRVNYVTYLDIHDFGQPLIANDEFFHDPAVQVWENVDYADAFYQENPAGMCGVNPSGRRLEHFPAGSRLQRDLTTETALLNEIQCLRHGRPHAWIKDYYWGTVALNGGYIDRPASWYEADGGDGTGRGFGFDRWWNRGGFEQGPEPTVERVRCVVAADAKPFVWNDNAVNDNGYPDRNDVPPVLFNGDFELPDLDRGIGGIGEANSLAGWRYHGGGGSAFVRPLPVGGQPNNSYLELRDNALQARHNRFFLPPETREMLFALAVDHIPNFGTHELEVRIGSEVVRRLSINEETSGFVVGRVESHQLTGRGGVNTLTFELLTAPSPITLRTAEIRLDNINFVVEPTSWIHSFYQTSPTNWRLIWRSWPDATFRLRSSSNLVAWPVVDSSSAPSAAGSFNIPHSSAPQVFFRGEADPAR